MSSKQSKHFVHRNLFVYTENKMNFVANSAVCAVCLIQGDIAP